MAGGRGWLIAGGALSAAASLAHIGCIVGGPSWYRFFGAGEPMARMAERGHWFPAVLTLGIGAVLAIWSAYAFSGAGLLPRLPLLRTALIVIAAVYLARGLLVLLPGSAWGRGDLSPAFILWSSLIVLGYGIVHAVGTWLAWPELSQKAAV